MVSGCDDGVDDTDAGPGTDSGPGEVDAGPGDESTTFMVEIENTSPAADYRGGGAFAVPVGETMPMPIGPGGAYEFSFFAGPGNANGPPMRLTFATMFVPSNDFFYAPAAAGIELFSGRTPLSGDITDQIMLWDAGTEVNQEPGTGADQVQRQAAPNTGAVDPDNTVRVAPDTFSNLPAVNEVIQVTVTNEMMNGAVRFTVRIENVSTLTTLGGTQPVPLSPGLFVIHTADNALFEPGMPDRGEGLEGIAEDGDPMALGTDVASRAFLTVVHSPGIWAVTDPGTTLFELGSPIPDMGLESLAEDGSPLAIAGQLANAMVNNGPFLMPVGGTAPGPSFPGQSFQFMLTAEPGQVLHATWMFVPSNDWLITLPSAGLPLFDGSGNPISGDIADQLILIDAGTEVDEQLGFGLSQVQNQTADDTGDVDPDTNVREITNPGLPALDSVISFTVTPML